MSASKRKKKIATETKAPEHVLSAYWQARNALFSEGIWADGGDARLQTIMAFLTQVQGWYPLLAKARDEEHYKTLLVEEENQIDLSHLRSPGPGYATLSYEGGMEYRITPNFPYSSALYPRDPSVLKFKEEAMLCFRSKLRLSARIWGRLTAAYAPIPLRVVGLCPEVLGWNLLLWSVTVREDRELDRAWVTPNEGPWMPYDIPSPGLWVPASGLFFVFDNYTSTWGFGKETKSEWFTALSPAENLMWTEMDKEAEKKQCEEAEAARRRVYRGDY